MRSGVTTARVMPPAQRVLSRTAPLYVQREISRSFIYECAKCLFYVLIVARGALCLPTARYASSALRGAVMRLLHDV